MTDQETILEVESVIKAEAEELLKLSERFDKEAVLRVMDALLNCRGKVVLAGCGTSGQAAKKIAHTLCCIEIPAVYMCPADAVHGELGLLQERDILYYDYCLSDQVSHDGHAHGGFRHVSDSCVAGGMLPDFRSILAENHVPDNRQADFSLHCRRLVPDIYSKLL